MKVTWVVLLCLVLASCSEDLDGNSPDGEPGDLAVITSQGFPCSEREVMTQHYGFDFEADQTLQPALRCSFFDPCMDCIHDADAEVTTVDLWVFEPDEDTETCTWRLVESVSDVPKDEAITRGSELTDECIESPQR